MFNQPDPDRVQKYMEIFENVMQEHNISRAAAPEKLFDLGFQAVTQKEGEGIDMHSFHAACKELGLQV